MAEQSYYRRDHLYFFLLHWRSMLLVGILCAFLAVGYTVYRNVTLWDAMVQDYEIAEEDYRFFYEAYLEEKDTLDAAVADCERQMAEVEQAAGTESEEYAELKRRMTELKFDKDMLTPPEAPFYPTWQSVVLSSLQRALFGFAGGASLICLIYYYLVFCRKGRIYSAGDVAEITLLPTLGVLPLQRKKGNLLLPDRWLQRRDGVRLKEPEAAFYRRVASEIRGRSQQAGRIQLLGPVPLEQIQAVAERLAPDLGAISVSCGSHPAEETVLKDCDAVVLAARRGTSRAKDLVSCQELAGLQGKPVIGTLVL